MLSRWASLGIVFLGCWLGACASQKEAASNAAIQRAIEEHLASRTGLAADKMVMEMKGVQVQGDTAEAEVAFRSTTDPPAQMTFHYQLRREGGQWKVDSGRPSSTESPHPSPEGSPAPEGSPQGGSSLPEGHPPVENAPLQR